jgi:hypothetical protein
MTMTCSELKTAAWISLWIFVLTTGNPDIIDLFVDFLQVCINILEKRYA